MMFKKCTTTFITFLFVILSCSVLAADNNFELVMLGTSAGPLPRSDRAQTSHVLIVNNRPYIIDAGDGVTRRVVQAGVNFLSVNQIFITHLHNDHMAGLATYLDSAWQYQKRNALDVYGPVGTERVVLAAMSYMSEDADIRYFEGKKANLSDVFKGHNTNEGVVFQDENVKVTAVENTHFSLDEDNSKKHKSFSYRFDTKYKSVVFSGDTGPSEKLVNLANGADILVSEVGTVEDTIATFEKNGIWKNKTDAEQAGFIKHIKEQHLTPQDVGEMAQKAGVKKVVLSHLAPTIYPNDKYERWKDLTKKYFSGEVVVAEDLMRIK